MSFIGNPKNAVNVTFQCETITVEKKCSTCEFGIISISSYPCKTCHSEYTPESNYTRWQFDPDYDPAEDVF